MHPCCPVDESHPPGIFHRHQRLDVVSVDGLMPSIKPHAPLLLFILRKDTLSSVLSVVSLIVLKNVPTSPTGIGIAWYKATSIGSLNDKIRLPPLQSPSGDALTVIQTLREPSVTFTTLRRQQSATAVARLGSVCDALVSWGISRRGHSIEARVHRGAAMMPPTASQRRPAMVSRWSRLVHGLRQALSAPRGGNVSEVAWERAKLAACYGGLGIRVPQLGFAAQATCWSAVDLHWAVMPSICHVLHRPFRKLHPEVVTCPHRQG